MIMPHFPHISRLNGSLCAIPLAAALMAAAALPAQGECHHHAPHCCNEPQVIEVADLPRPVTGNYALEIGRRSAVSTYLGPVAYAGTVYGASGRWSKCMPFAPQRAMMEFEARVEGGLSLLNPRQNSSMQSIDAEFAWNMRAWWRLPGGFALSVGGGPEIGAGALALLKNSNNPVSVNVAGALAAAASASWQHTFGRLPVVATLNLRSPLLGIFYMPGYGETYYEMYLGNHSGLVHCGWPGNHRKLAMHLNLRLDLGRTAMEVGYRLDWQRNSANHLVMRTLTNAFTIGVIPGGLGLKRPSPQVRPF